MMNDQTTNGTQSMMHRDGLGYSWYASCSAEHQTTQQNNFICDLSHIGFLSANGEDAVDFLHGQLTNDLHLLPRDESQISGYCSAKGRLICIFRIHHGEQGGLVLQAHRESLTTAAERLRRYVMRARVSLTIEPDLACFGVVGDQCRTVLEGLVGDLPARPGDCRQYDGTTIICHPHTSLPRYQVVAGGEAAARIRRQLLDLYPQVGSWAWASLEIQNGLASIFPATVEQFVPQMLNMDIIGGLSFKKGCYPGQEIVARLHYLGKLKTRMVHGSVDIEAPPMPGDKVYGADSDQSTGMIVDCVPMNGGYRVLTTTRLDNLDRGGVRLQSRNGPVVEIRELPYAIDG